MSRKARGRLLSVVSLSACVALAACGGGRDAEVNAVLTEMDAFTKELVGKVKSAPNPSAGVDEAQKHLDSRRVEVTAKINSIRGVRESQVSEETRKRMMESETDGVRSVSDLQIEYIDESLKDPAFKTRLDKLTADYNSLFKL